MPGHDLTPFSSQSGPTRYRLGRRISRSSSESPGPCGRNKLDIPKAGKGQCSPAAIGHRGAATEPPLTLSHWHRE
eukprot:688131-Hanusia_phi.AAC.2